MKCLSYEKILYKICAHWWSIVTYSGSGWVQYFEFHQIYAKLRSRTWLRQSYSKPILNQCFIVVVQLAGIRTTHLGGNLHVDSFYKIIIQKNMRCLHQFCKQCNKQWVTIIVKVWLPMSHVPHRCMYIKTGKTAITNRPLIWFRYKARLT